MKLVRYILPGMFVAHIFFCTTTLLAGNAFLVTAQEKINKIAQKNPLRHGFENCEQISHKPSLEFKQAVNRYIKHTDTHFMHSSHRYIDENVSYKKELRYLFKNYGKLSTIALLSRIRSAHQEMVKLESDVDSDFYKRYEQISSAFLLICAQVLAHDARNQILNALDEVDNLIVYWRYQQQHQMSYFFSKAPTKWIMGKSQAQEIINNLRRLERKQRELYTILGALTGHVYTFSERDMTYDACYTWIEELFVVLSCVQILPYSGDGTRFDNIAAELSLKIKRVGSLKSDCLATIASTRKSNHFVRNWMTYATVLAAAGYVSYYYAHNYTAVNIAFNDRFASLRNNWMDLVVKPSEDIWDTFFGKVEDVVVEDPGMELEKGIFDFAKDLKDLEIKKDFNKKTSNDFKKYLDGDWKNTQEKMKTLLKSWLSWGYIDQEKYDEIVNAEAVGNVAPFQQFFFDINKGPKELCWSSDEIIDALVVLAELKVYHYGSSLIQVVFELIIDYGIPVVKEVLILLSKGNKEWAAAYKKVNLILNVAALTPTIIVGGTGCSGLYKAYRWATKKNYSPIRIALADVNALLIESATQFDNYHYGKLVYLICKLRYKASSLKDPLAHEFLIDVAKLESKRYAPDVKQGIVDNMFNKYAFLGRVAV